MLQAEEAYSVRDSFRGLSKLSISLHNFSKRIQNYWIVPHINKILQKCWHILRIILTSVTWCPTEKIEIRLLLFPMRKLTVASRQSKECGSEWRPTDVGTLWPHSEVAPSSRLRKKKEKRKLVVGQGSWRTELKPSTPGKRRRKNISDTKEPFLQASTKNSIKSISP